MGSECVYVRGDPGCTTSGDISGTSPESKLALRGYGRVPVSVLSDVRLTDRDVRVFAAMALFERGGILSVGLRLIATTACVPRRRVADNIKRLIEFGHVELSPGKHGYRSIYRLLSLTFTESKASVRVEKTVTPRYARKPSSQISSTVLRARAWAKSSGNRKLIDDILDEVAS